MLRTVKRLVPPIAWGLARDVARGRWRPEWTRVPDGAADEVGPSGWSAPEVAEALRRRWSSWACHLAGTGPLAASHEGGGELDLYAHNAHMVFGYALLRAARGRPRLSLLDWGGGVGAYRLLARALAPDLTVEYHARDLPPVVAAGRALQPDARFFEHDGCLDRSYDLVLVSGALQYEAAWRELLVRLATATAPGGHLLLSRIPVTGGQATHRLRQRPHGLAGAKLVGWCFNRAGLLGAAGAAGLTLLREFHLGPAFDASARGASPTEWGALFAAASR